MQEDVRSPAELVADIDAARRGGLNAADALTANRPDPDG